MKQHKMVRKVYKACLDYNQERLSELQRKEFKKIFKRKLEGKSFSAEWAIVKI